MFQVVCDLNKHGAKSKPYKMSLSALQDEIEISYDAEVGDGQPPCMHEQFTGKCIPYIDLDLVESGEKTFGNYAKFRKKKIAELRKAIKKVFGDDVNVILADRSGYSVKHEAYKLSLWCWVFQLSTGLWSFHDG